MIKVGQFIEIQFTFLTSEGVLFSVEPVELFKQAMLIRSGCLVLLLLLLCLSGDLSSGSGAPLFIPEEAANNFPSQSSDWFTASHVT